MNRNISLFILVVFFINCSKSTTDGNLQSVIKDQGHSKVIELENKDLQVAIENQEYPKIIELINKGLDPNTLLEDGLSILCWAIVKDAIELTKVLIKKGADVNFKTKSGSTPLSIAFYRASDELVNLLIDSDIDWTYLNTEKYNYFELAMLHNRINTLHYMLRNEGAFNSVINKDSVITRFIYHWSDEMEDIVSFLVEHGYKIKAESQILYNAIFENKYGAVKWFIDYGISPTNPIIDNLTPLGFALDIRYDISTRGSEEALEESDKIIRLLLEHIEGSEKKSLSREEIDQLFKEHIKKN